MENDGHRPALFDEMTLPLRYRKQTTQFKVMEEITSGRPFIITPKRRLSELSTLNNFPQQFLIEQTKISLIRFYTRTTSMTIL